MRKSVWLISAGLTAILTPTYAQAAQQPEVDVPGTPETDTDRQAAEPTQGATAEGAAVDDSTVQPDVQSAGGEIIVTATRRNEALSDVPLAVSAVTAETLEYTGATDIRQLNQVSPSLLVSSTSSESAAAVARIRGIGTVGDNPGLESSVALFIDGVYRSRTAVGLTELGPLDRIEVLRGPQGTLFGRNASAGLISVITAKPLFTNMIAGEATIGNYDLRRLEGSVTGPLSDAFAARIDAVYMKRDGFLEDVISGRDVNDRNRWMVRAQGLYEPAENLSVRIVGDITQRREECCAAPYLPTRDFVRNPDGSFSVQPSSFANGILRPLGAIINDDPFERQVSITPGRDYDSDVDDWGLSGEVVYDFGGAELTSITAYRFNDVVRGQDPDFNNLDIWFRESGGGYETRFKTLTQELRLQGEAMGGSLDWLVGAYYANEKLRQLDNLTYGADYERYANCILFSSVFPAAVSPTSPLCVGPALTGALTQLQQGITQLTAAINQLQAIPARTPQQEAQLQALLVQRATLQGQLTQLGLFNANPARPGFGSVAAVLGLPGFQFSGTGLDDEYNQTSNNWALFTHNIFTLMPGLDLTVGARYTREKKRLTVDLNDNNVLCAAFQGLPAPLAGLAALQGLPCVSPSVPGGHFEATDTKSEGKLSGTVVLSYKPVDQLLTYASYSRGYKAGGFNLDRSALTRFVFGTAAGGVTTAASLDDLKFDPEINDAIELGVKYNGPGIDINIAAFHQLFRNFQLNTFTGTNFVVVNVNSCEEDLNGADIDNNPTTGACSGDTRAGVKSMGVEFELFTRPLPNVNWNFGAIYADTHYRENLVGSDGTPLTTALFQLPGRRISNSSLWTATSSFAWTPPIGGTGLRGLFYVDGRYMSEFNTGSDLDLEKMQENFFVVNGRIGLHGPDRMWGVELWAQNLLDEDFYQVAFDAPPAQGSGTERAVRYGFIPRSTALYGVFLGEPRTYGLTLRGRF